MNKEENLRTSFFDHSNCKRHKLLSRTEDYNWYSHSRVRDIIVWKENFQKFIERDKKRILELEEKLKEPENDWFKHWDVYLELNDLDVEIECMEIDLKIMEQEIVRKQNNS